MSRLALALALALGCTSTTPLEPDAGAPDAPPDATPDAPAPDVAAPDAPAADASVPDAPVIPPPPTEVMRTSIGPFNVAPGVEETRCVTVDLGNERPGFIRGIRVRLSEGSHHLIVTTVDDAPAPPSRCSAFAHGGAKVFIAQQPESGLTYPPGAGLPIEAHQSIGIEMHYINYLSEEPIDIDGQVEFDIAESDAELEDVQFLFTGDYRLFLPARERTTVTSFHSLPEGARVFALTSHTHQLGEVSYIERARSESDEGPILHESTTWAEPPLDTFDPWLVFGAGEGLKLTCTFNNTTDSTVTFGEGFDDEMCFLWAYYLNPE